MKHLSRLAMALSSILLCILANAYLLICALEKALPPLLLLFLLLNLFAGAIGKRIAGKRLYACRHALVLLTAFAVSLPVSIAFHAVLAFRLLPQNPTSLLWSAVFCVVASAIVFWNGILCAYLSSHQLGVRLRVIGALCGMIPVANLIALRAILRTLRREVDFETERQLRNRARREERVCSTRYPILLVHGVFFRDYKHFDYWGRIPADLRANGATVWYGEHQSALSIEKSAREIAARIRYITDSTGCGKVNIIAHSKGGLDCRYAIDTLGIGDRVASLITVNTPHRGCVFAERMLYFAPEELKEKVAGAYNSILKKMGDAEPDFLEAVGDLTSEACARFNEEHPDVPKDIYVMSIGSVIGNAKKNRFPLNLSYHLVKTFDGKNDGLVGENSFAWGDNYHLVEIENERGISHGDIIDLYRENIEGFDVREFYVDLVSDLRRRGL